ncbi:MAG TPA: pentapeptide repeat-containing protein [Mycobacteriales bacterium]|nr:pentapeptide repeat-containing protein [Mycobacteriales bacterium]
MPGRSAVSGRVRGRRPAPPDPSLTGATRGAGLAGVDLSGVRLREADLTDADLRRAVFRDADLAYARLTGADLRGARTHGVDWRSLDVTGAKLDVGQAMAFATGYGADLT